MKNWTLSDLAEFGRLDNGDKIQLHGTTYILHNVNIINDTCKLEDINNRQEPKSESTTYTDEELNEYLTGKKPIRKQAVYDALKARKLI